MTYINFVGYAASGLVLATFCMRRMVPLRAVALCSNIVFVLYGHLAKIEPILVLHLILFPINPRRLTQSLFAQAALPTQYSCMPSSGSGGINAPSYEIAAGTPIRPQLRSADGIARGSQGPSASV